MAITSICLARRAALSDAAVSTSGILAPAGTFISARTERTPLISSMTQCISAGGVGVAAQRPSAIRLHQHFRAALPSLPKLFGDERHEGMQQFQQLVAHPGGGGASFRLGALVRAVEQRLGELQIPVAEHVIDKVIGGAGGIVETQRPIAAVTSATAWRFRPRSIC